VRLTREDESFQGMMVAIHDVTSGAKLKDDEHDRKHYWEIFNSTNDALFVHDAYTGAIVDVNKTVEKCMVHA